jgi:AcrR family transcriptional regulator
MRSATAGEAQPNAPADPRAQRRASRRAESRTQVLDAAERVFGAHGLRAGSLREIALLSGFSTASIYLFFDNKQHLVSETLTRRGVELVAALQEVADRDLSPLDKLHCIVDVTVEFFEARPDFRRLLRHLAGGQPIIGPALGELGETNDRSFVAAMTIIAGIVSSGHDAGEVRAGDPNAIAHLYSVLINEHVLLTASGDSNGGGLTADQFHGLIDGALRSAQTRRVDRQLLGPSDTKRAVGNKGDK